MGGTRVTGGPVKRKVEEAYFCFMSTIAFTKAVDGDGGVERLLYASLLQSTLKNYEFADFFIIKVCISLRICVFTTTKSNNLD